MADPVIKLIKKPDDPICMRISAGGDPETGYYCVFRGAKSDVIAGLKIILKALESGEPVQVDPE